MDSKNLRETYFRYLTHFLAKDESTATAQDRFLALAYAVRSELMRGWIDTQKRYREQNVRRVYYLSTEYVLGKSLYQNILSLDIEKELSQTARSLGFSLEDLYEQEDDFMLGNGSEGRLAACLLEALASNGYPAMAYGIRYEFGQFHQEIRNGVQVERPNDWIRHGSPWEIVRPEYACTVRFGGECRRVKTDDLLGPYEWKNPEIVHAIPYDVPIVGYRNNTVNTLRLWSARASEEFLPDFLNHNDYERACEDKSKYARITQVLFPDEDVRRATDLRMKQQYFFVSAAIQDIVRRFKLHNFNVYELDKKVAIHLGGSSSALAIPELMRILVDVEKVPWAKAWEMSKNIFSYTSHAISREDSEIWPIYKVGQILPRHLQIIFDLNQTHLDEVRKKYGRDAGIVRELSLIEEGEVKRIRFADIAVLGSFSVNGVSKEQTAVLMKKVFPYLSSYFPDRFACEVNGVAVRRWLLDANRGLSQLITRQIGERWINNPELLGELEKSADDVKFLQSLAEVKREAKLRLADKIREILGFSVDEAMLFDVQLGKIHMAKRQLLHVLYILHAYLKAKKGQAPAVRRFHVFAGKASPSDFLAKQIIHLISATADCINGDPQVNGAMQVVFIPDFSMSWAERVAPAVDLSEQLPTATLEPSGAFGMKFALNGAVTLASRSGSNIEIADRVGNDYIFTFGKTGDELAALRDYRPSDVVARDDRLKAVFSFLETELIPRTPEGQALFPLLSNLRDLDRQYVLIDFNDYTEKQERIDKLFADTNAWMKTAAVTLARSGFFSSDRSTQEYARKIWKVSPI